MTDSTDTDCPKELQIIGNKIQQIRGQCQALRQMASDAHDVFDEGEVQAIRDAAVERERAAEALCAELDQALHIWENDIVNLEKCIEQRKTLIERNHESLVDCETLLQTLAAGQASLHHRLEAARAQIGVTEQGGAGRDSASTEAGQKSPGSVNDERS